MWKNPNAINFESLKRVLVIKLRNHGDVLLSTPVFHALKSHYPDLEIDALIYSDTRMMLEDNPDIAQIHCIDRNWKKLGLAKHLKEELALAKKLKQRSYDLVIHLTEHMRGAMLSRYLRPQYSITAKNWKRTSKFWHKSFTHHYPLTKKSPQFIERHIVEIHLDALRHLGLELSEQDKTVSIVPGEEAQDKIHTILANHGVDKPFIVFHPTSRWMFKSWKWQTSKKFLEMLSREKHPIIVTSGPDPEEKKYVQNMLSENLKGATDLSGQLSLKELAALISRSTAFFGMDSVPMHIAASFGIPTTTIFGPSNEFKWGPWNTHHSILTSNHPCRPCDLAGCGDGGLSECIESVKPEIAVQNVLALFDARQET
jgi:heptosyltransferase-3